MTDSPHPKKFAIVLPPPEDDGLHPVWLMTVDESGALDWDRGYFNLSFVADEASALNYAKDLANYTMMRILQIASKS